MKADLHDYKHSDLTEKVIKAFFRVYNGLGYGFLEKIYERALALELKESGLAASTQVPITVNYRGQSVGEYAADILVENKLILELKAVKTLAAEHEAQLLNYLMATDIEVGLLLNFGPKPQIKRKVFANERKVSPQQNESAQSAKISVPIEL
jgi:GxxExxY protein